MRVILTHENTDFDALAAQLAAAKLYPDALPVLPQRLNRDVRQFLTTYGDQLPFVDANKLPRRRITEAILVDTQTASPIKGMDAHTPLRVFDHHPLRKEPRENAVYVVAEIGATTSLLAEKLREGRVALTPLEATLLLLGIYEDTGSLSFPGTTPRDLRSAAWLLEQEASLVLANTFLRRPLDEHMQPVYSQLVESVEWHTLHDRALLVASAQLDEWLEELSTLAHKLDDVFDPDACFLLFAFRTTIQLIARSSVQAIDVGEIAREFGGGGHGAAAAALIANTSLKEVHDKLVEMFAKHVKPAITVREIMSFGVHTLHPDMSLHKAAEQVQKYGHEGFPVVQDGELVGVLTRREIELALRHRLAKSTVRSYMHTGDVSVAPDESVTKVQRIMTDQGLGQIPVVENGQVLGIVTRTDLVKLWGVQSRPSRRLEIQALLRQTLPIPLLNLLIQARDAANSMGYSLYVVGGFVRDLLLRSPTLDLDLVIEGDAIAVARELARQLKGRVRSHARFGTAKVILRGTAGTSLPPSLDLVTARTEFYQHPTALPEIERSSIKQDLYRRDFTINTMAICLDRDRYGELFDFYGGERDLRERWIRVLHNLSFVEDPTRILRAARLEQRLGFSIEARTAELIYDALGLLDRVSGERLRHELELILSEHDPTGMLERLAEMGVLRHLEPGLQYDDWLALGLCRARDWLDDQAGSKDPDLSSDSDATQHSREGKPLNRQLLFLSMLTARLSKPHLDRFVQRLRFSHETTDYLHQVRTLRSMTWRLNKATLRPSRIYALLRPYSQRAITAFSLTLDSSPARDNVLRYLQNLRWTRLHIDGEFLRQQGLPPGPAYRRILTKLLDLRLDGKLRTVREEEEMARRLIAAEAVDAQGRTKPA